MYLKQKNLILISASILALIVSFQNCSGEHEMGELEYYSAESQAIKVIDAKCVSCHSPGSGIASPIADIKDVAALEAQEINGRAVLIFGEPQNSLFYQILIDKLPPHDSITLSDYQMETIAAWISGDEFLIPDSEVYFYQVDAILKDRCASCHGNSGGFSVGNYTAVMRNVVAGEPEESELYKRLVLPDGDPAKMPRSGTITESEIKTIYEWIRAGALNQ